MTAAADLRHLAHHILAAEGIRFAQDAFGIVPPLAVHEEPVMVYARPQFHRRPPHAVHALMQIDGTFLPLREVTDQLHAHRIRRAERKSLRPSVAPLFVFVFFAISLFLSKGCELKPPA